MTTSDDLTIRLIERAERGAPRGASAVLDAARTNIPTAPAPSPGRTNRRAVLGGVAVALVLVVVAALAVERRPDPRASADDPWCTALAAPVATSGLWAGDVVVYVAPSSTADSELAALADRLRGDSRVNGVELVDQDAAYEWFRELFAEEPTLLENVVPSSLPPWAEVDLVDPSMADDLVEELLADPTVYEARTGLGEVRALDLLVWPGARVDVWDSPGNPDLISGRYPSTWHRTAEVIVDATPSELTVEVQILLDRIERGPGYPLVPGEDAGDPTFAATASAAQAVRASASERCGIHVSDRFTQPSMSSTATTEAAGD